MGKCKIQATGSNMSIANGKIVRGFAETGSIKYHTFVSQATTAPENRVLPDDSYVTVVPVTETSWLAITRDYNSPYYVSVLTLNKATGTITAGTKFLLRSGDSYSIQNLWKVSDNTFVCIFDPAYDASSSIYVYKLIISGSTITVSTFEIKQSLSKSVSTKVVACLIDSTHVMAVVSDNYTDPYGKYIHSIYAYVINVETMTQNSGIQLSSSNRSQGHASRLAQYKSNKFCVFKENYNIELELDANYMLSIKSNTNVSDGPGTFGSIDMGRYWLVEEGYWVNFDSSGGLALFSGDDTKLNNTAIQTIAAPSGIFKKVYRTPDGRTILVIDSNIYEYVWGDNKRFTRVLLGTTVQNFGNPIDYSSRCDTWITDELKLFIVNSSRQYWLDTVERLTSLLFREATSSSGITGISKDNLKENELGKVWVLNE